MSGQNIALLAVLALLVAGCFSSGMIAKKVYPGNMEKRTRLSLLIKLITALIALAIYIIVFML
ncbi:MAG: hypothetical protein II879_01685 [Clostridia bacterium]|nr:hypothetical protein [Clostridia bacterium]